MCTFKSNHKDILVRTDKNGTQYWISEKCPKCGGTGHINGYEYVEGGICFKCGGSGDFKHSWIVRTKEYQDQLDAKRLEKARKAAPDKNKTFFLDNGFDEEGYTHIFLGKTYAFKDDLRLEGAKYHSVFGWHSAKEIEPYRSEKVHVSKLFDQDVAGAWTNSIVSIFYTEVEEELKKATYEAFTTVRSHHFGSVGDKVELNLIYLDAYKFETNYTYYGETNYIHKFKDNSGNIFIWKTTKNLDYNEDRAVIVRGTIKAHQEHNGEPQTTLTRCKVVFI